MTPIRQIITNAKIPCINKKLTKNAKTRTGLVDALYVYYGFPEKISIRSNVANKIISEVIAIGRIDKDLFLNLILHWSKVDCARRTNRLEERRRSKYTRLDVASLIVICNAVGSVFYASPEWRRVRYSVLKLRGNCCEACGRSPSDGVVIHVDHIKPRSIFPELALEESNLQILCEDCNMGKSNKDSTDWRVPAIRRQRLIA